MLSRVKHKPPAAENVQALVSWAEAYPDPIWAAQVVTIVICMQTDLFGNVTYLHYTQWEFTHSQGVLISSVSELVT